MGADGTLVVASGGEAALALTTFDPAPEGRTDEAWIIEDGVVLPAGLFDGRDGAVVHLEGAVGPGALVAVTIESAGGVDQPTSDPILTAALT